MAILIPTYTITSVGSARINIHTFYSGDISINSGVIQAFIANISSTIGTVSYIEGELIIVTTNNDIHFSIDNEGNLIINASNSNKYYISENGDLMHDDSL